MGAPFFRLVGAGLGILLLSLLLVFAHDALTQARTFSVKHVVIEGNKRLSDDSIQSIGRVAPGVNIFAVNLRHVQQRLRHNGWVARAQVSRELPDRIVIRIQEFEPAGILDMGKKYFVSPHGSVFKQVEALDSQGLPRIAGLSLTDLPSQDHAPSAVFTDMLDMLALTRKNRSLDLIGPIDRIHVDRDIGITVAGSGWIRKVRFGRGQYAYKYRRLENLLPYLHAQRRIAQVDVISLENENHIVVVPKWKEPIDLNSKEVFGAGTG